MRFAQHFKATIVMLHVVLLSQPSREAELEMSGPSMTRKAAQERLEILAKGVRRLGIPVETHGVDGLVCEAIIASVTTYDSDLLVLGTHGVHLGLDHLLIGSNKEKILLGAECPTLRWGPRSIGGRHRGTSERDHVLFGLHAGSHGCSTCGIVLG